MSFLKFISNSWKINEKELLEIYLFFEKFHVFQKHGKIKNEMRTNQTPKTMFSNSVETY